jgi:hypothetical protein
MTYNSVWVESCDEGKRIYNNLRSFAIWVTDTSRNGVRYPDGKWSEVVVDSFPPTTGFDSYGTWPWTNPLTGGCIAIGMNSFLFRSTWVHSWFIGSSCCSCVFVNFCVLSVFVNCCLFLCFPGLYFVLRYCSLICPFGFSIFFFLHYTIN